MSLAKKPISYKAALTSTPTPAAVSINKYTWTFYPEEHHAELSCISTSVAAAREQILERLARITAVHAEYKRLNQQFDKLIKEKDPAFAAVRAQLDALRASFGIDSFIGSWSLTLGDFTEDLMLVMYPDEPISIKEYIRTTEPKVTPFECVSLRVNSTN